ncbi:MAG: hypothetical protein ACWGQW_11300 [bacterium]
MAEKMLPPEEKYKNHVNIEAETGVGAQASIDHSLRLKIEDLCLDELNKSCNNLALDKYQRIEKLLLKIASRIAEPLLSQIQSVNGGESRRAHNLRMLSEAFELQEVKRGQ